LIDFAPWSVSLCRDKRLNSWDVWVLAVGGLMMQTFQNVSASRRGALAVFGWWAHLLLAVVPATAAFPEKAIHIVVPFAPGGGTDVIARTIGASLAEVLGQPVIIDNKPGASTIIGTDAVAKAVPDGYTLLLATAAFAVNPSVQPKLPFDTNKDFAAVSLIGRSHNVLVVRPDSPLRTVQDVIAAAKTNPGKLSFASQGSATSAHLAGELFKNLAHVDMTHVPYRGAGPALTDLLGGQVDMMFATSTAVGTFLSSNRLRAIATTAPAGMATPSGVPTVADAGLPGYVVESWYGIYAPVGTAPEVVAKLNAAVKLAVKTDAFQKRVLDEGMVVSAGAPEELDTYVGREQALWKKIVVENKITAD
jgi:tripartite-type tricarboxylate transporter receptor subunit TctC